MPEQCELLLKYQLKWSDEDFACAIEFYMRAKCLIVTSKLTGESLVVNSKLQQRNCFGVKDDRFIPVHISRIEQFEYKNDEYFAVGMTDGSVQIRVGEQIMSKNCWAVVEPPKEEDDKVTCINFFFPNKLVIGSKQG